MAGNTKQVEFTGKAAWAQVYKPDEFRGAVRWRINLYMDDPKEWDKFKEHGIQKKVKEDENGKYFQVARPTTKMMKGKVVNFAPPFILDADGNTLVSYVGEDGKWVRSYEGDKVVKRVGDPILIGNGSVVAIGLSVYPTAMGPGNRLDYIKLIDLIEYKPEESTVEVMGNESSSTEEEKTDTTKKTAKSKDTTPPW